MTETVKHTPGAWFLERTDTHLWVGVEKAAGGKVGEVIVGVEYGEDYSSDHNDRAHANARLIAAAPTMLLALQSVVSERPDWELITDAIIEATGEQP